MTEPAIFRGAIGHAFRLSARLAAVLEVQIGAAMVAHEREQDHTRSKRIAKLQRQEAAE